MPAFLPGQEALVVTCSRARLHGWKSHPGREAGENKPTLVLLHFFGGSSRTWEPVAAELALEYPCVALDLRGYGGTEVTEASDEVASYSIDLTAADVVEAITHLGLKDYVLVGHSMGGKIALALVAGQGCPAGLRALALVAPSPATPEPMPDEERARLLAGYCSADAARETLSKIAAAPLPRSLADKVVADEVRVAYPAWHAWLERGSVADISARLTRVRVPVFLLAGEKDANITARLLKREIADQLPTEFAHDPETVPDAAHLLPLEAPSAVADFIRRAANNGR